MMGPRERQMLTVRTPFTTNTPRPVASITEPLLRRRTGARARPISASTRSRWNTVRSSTTITRTVVVVVETHAGRRTLRSDDGSRGVAVTPRWRRGSSRGRVSVAGPRCRRC